MKTRTVVAAENTVPIVAACVGIDWADDAHEIALMATGSETIEMLTLPHSPDEIHRWLAALATRFDGAPIAVAVETSRGPLVHALFESPIVLLYPINPRSMHRYREAFSPNGAKDDAPDARLLLDLVRKHREQLVLWRPKSPTLRELDRLVQFRRTAVEECTKCAQRLTALLKEYFPVALDLVGVDVTSGMACDFLERWPTLAQLKRARRTTLEQFYTRHNCRSATRRAEYLARIEAAQPLTTDAAIIASSAHFVTVLTAQLRALRTGIDRLDTAIAAAFAELPDAPLFSALPGAGAVLAPRLLVAFGEARDRFPTAEAMATATGIAPITVKSGNSRHVRWRWCSNTFLRQSLHEVAQHSILHCAWARSYYHVQRSRGKTRHMAIRALAFKWIRIIWRCWQDHTPYDDARYTRALIARGSPLIAHLDTPAAA